LIPKSLAKGLDSREKCVIKRGPSYLSKLLSEISKTDDKVSIALQSSLKTIFKANYTDHAAKTILLAIMNLLGVTILVKEKTQDFLCGLSLVTFILNDAWVSIP